MEPVAISLFRCLPRSHPVYKLLRSHLQYVVQINLIARDDLIVSGKPAQQTLAVDGASSAKKAFKTFSFDDLDIPKLILKRGLHDEKLLQNFFYRDDIIPLWEIVEDYVGRVIKYYYKSNVAVVEDFELQSWINEIATEGYGWMNGDTKGVPKSFNTVDELVQFCTLVVGTSSLQHTAVNFGQFDLYEFIPNVSTGLRMPIHKRGEGSLERIMNTLPNAMNAAIQILLTYQLSQFSPDEVYLGEFPDKFFGNDEKIERIQEKFRKKLSEFSKDAKKRNEKLEYPYEYLLPERIPTGVAV